MTYSAVDSWAHKKSVPVYYSALEFLKDTTQADIGILAHCCGGYPKPQAGRQKTIYDLFCR